MISDLQILQSTEMFASLSADSLKKIAAWGSTHQLQRGDTLFAQGDDPEHIFIVKQGRVAIINLSVDGRESVVALMEKGDLFGELPLFDGGKRSAGARCLQPSKVIVIPYEPLRVLYQTQPYELWGVVKLLVARLRATDEILADNVFLDVTGRTAKRLLELAGDKDEFTLPVTQDELAGMVGASRERVNKALATFVRLRWIKQSDRRYTITNRKQLTSRAR